MPLFLCRFEIDVMVEADSRDEAEDVAELNLEEEARNVWGVNGGTQEIRFLQECPPEWLDSIPYGGDRTDSVRMILSEEQPAPEPPKDTQTIDMFASEGAPSEGKETNRGE